jgi:hypothetical protein
VAAADTVRLLSVAVRAALSSSFAVDASVRLPKLLAPAPCVKFVPAEDTVRLASVGVDVALTRSVAVLEPLIAAMVELRVPFAIALPVDDNDKSPMLLLAVALIARDEYRVAIARLILPAFVEKS